jgi:hypothetical protein
MDYKTFKSHIGRAKLTNKEFAELVGLNTKSITNFAAKDNVPIHWAIVAVLMGELSHNEVEFMHLLGRLNIMPNKVRGGAAKGRWGGSKQQDFLLDIAQSETS